METGGRAMRTQRMTPWDQNFRFTQRLYSLPLLPMKMMCLVTMIDIDIGHALSSCAADARLLQVAMVVMFFLFQAESQQRHQQ